MALSPKESGKFISENAIHVTIKTAGIEKLGRVLVDEIASGRLNPENFSETELHPKPQDPRALDWLFVVDTLNFCFWHRENEEGWKVNGYSGYFALCAAINRALKENIDILNPKFYSTITEEELKKVLRSDTKECDTKVQIPLLTERVKCLHEVGSVLLENFEGSFNQLVSKANNNAKTLLELIVSNFKCFRDEATFKNQKVSFYKRAQILVGHIWAIFKGQRFFEDLDTITMFADYRVPQTLLWFGVLAYSQELNDKLKSNQILENGDVEEQEIRGCSIQAVEILKEFVNETSHVNSILIDHFLWDFRRKHAKEIEEIGLPFHKVYCIYY